MNPTGDSYVNVLYDESFYEDCFFVVVNTIVSLGVECPGEKEGRRGQRVLCRGLNMGTAFRLLPTSLLVARPERREKRYDDEIRRKCDTPAVR